MAKTRESEDFSYKCYGQPEEEQTSNVKTEVSYHDPHGFKAEDKKLNISAKVSVREFKEDFLAYR